MSGSDIAVLLIRFGPIAFDLIDDLVGVWEKDLSPAELKEFVLKRRKSVDEYVEAERQARLNQPK
jgi:hypothetical protein